MALSIAVCDDDETDLQYITGLVNAWAAQARIPVSVRTFPSAEAFLFHYAENRDFDILLLDVEMGKLNGIDLARQIRAQDSCVQIVFFQPTGSSRLMLCSVSRELIILTITVFSAFEKLTE